MSNIITALILGALIITSGLVFTRTAFTSIDYLAQSYKQMEETSQEAARTDIRIILAERSGDMVDVLVQNTGNVNIARFANWDVFIHYYDTDDRYLVRWLSFSPGTVPGTNKWAVTAIYANDDLDRTEVFETGVLNPGEVAHIRLYLAPPPGAGTLSLVSVATPNGITASSQFENPVN